VAGFWGLDGEANDVFICVCFHQLLLLMINMEHNEAINIDITKFTLFNLKIIVKIEEIISIKIP
jgi:hypothetical protein